jgi:hypothetical protein
VALHQYSIGKICFEKIFYRDTIHKYFSRNKAANIVKKHQNSKNCARTPFSEGSKSKCNQEFGNITQEHIIS